VKYKLLVVDVDGTLDNAPAEVKAITHYTTLDVDHNGLAMAIRKFLLG